MTKKDLIPLGLPGNEEYDKAVRAKLKGSASNKRKMAQRIAGLKKANPENIEAKLLALVSDPNISALEIMGMIEAVKQRGELRPEVVVQLINTMIKAHATIFGTKSFNVNMNMSPTSAKSINEIWIEVQNEQSNTGAESNGEGDTEESSDGEEHTVSS